MPRIILMGSIRQRAGGLGAVQVGGATAGAAIRDLEQVHPPLRGWIVDEQGRLRRHVKLFRGSMAVGVDAALGEDEDLHVVGAISGG